MTIISWKKWWLAGKTAAALFLLVPGLPGQAQNLVPNGSFELSDPDCPMGFGNIADALYWSNPNTASPDLLAYCAILPDLQLPNSEPGFQHTYHGDKYAHFGKLKTPGWNGEAYSEGITVRLTEQLEAGMYCLELFVSIIELPKYMMDRLDVALTKDKPLINASHLEALSPDGYADGIPLDTMNWIPLSMEVTAEAGDRYLTLGSFAPLSATNFLLNYDNHLGIEGAGFFVDFVSLTKCGFSLRVADTTVCSSDPLILSVKSYSDIHYQWYFGNTLLSDSSTWQSDAPEQGWYYLEYTDFRGDTYTDSAYVTVEDCSEWELPNVFTPNGDSRNDLWKPIGKDIGQVEIAVYSRWGQVVFTYTGDFASFGGWDGGDAPEGTYYVVARAVASGGRLMEQKGTITLLR